MPKCANCGADVPEDKNFCSQCGAPVSQEGAPAAPPQPPEPAPTAPPQPGTGAAPPPLPGAPGGITPPPMPLSGPQAEPKKGISRGAKIAIIIGACAIVLIILAVVLGVILFTNIITAPADVANNYVKALNAGDHSTAWNYLTTGTQNQETRQGYETKITVFKGHIRKWYTTSVNVETGGISKIVMSVTYTDNTKATWDMTLTKQNGKWKIDTVAPR